MYKRFREGEIVDEVGCYVAGLTDGEGCFYIAKHHCEFIIKLRDDDRPLLEWLQARLGVGALYAEPGNQLGGKNRRPQVRFQVRKRQEVLWLTEFFDHYRLQSKKARDYAVWREAVIAWYAGSTDLGEYKAKLADVRRYPEDLAA